jgi:hypothetical protein
VEPFIPVPVILAVAGKKKLLYGTLRVALPGPTVVGLNRIETKQELPD